jgi:hypothetical protein
LFNRKVQLARMMNDNRGGQSSTARRWETYHLM